MQPEARIYLAAQRGITQNTWYRSYHTFNFKDYQTESRQPLGMLTTLNDDTLSGHQTITHEINQGDLVLLLPIVGGIHVTDSTGEKKIVEAGEVGLFANTQHTSIQITNPYTALINYLHIQLRFNFAVHTSHKISIDLDAHENNLIAHTLAEQTHTNKTTIHIGKYTGRSEGQIQANHTNTTQFAFVIEGAFEVQNRLLHARDGLALPNAQTVDFEALSNEAIILFIEQHY